MANNPQAKKRSRQAESARARNASQRSMYRTYLKRVNTAVAAGDKEAAAAALADAVPVLDKLVGKGILHKNKASRHKSRLHSQIDALG